MNCDHLSRAVVAELQQDDLPAPTIMDKPGEDPSRFVQLGLNVSTDSLVVNNENSRPLARKIMRRKESRNKRSSSQSSSRGVTPDPGRHRFNPRKDGFSTLYNCLLKLYNASSDGVVSWNEARNLYRKEVGRHLNSEELNLICGTASRTKHELLHTKLATIIEPVDTKGFFVRMLLDQDGVPVPLPSPSASDDDSNSTRQSLSRLTSIEDEEKIQLEEKRRELMEKLMREGLLTSDGRATVAEEPSTGWKLDNDESVEHSEHPSFVESLDQQKLSSASQHSSEEKPKMVGVVTPFLRVNSPEKDVAESVMDDQQNQTEMDHQEKNSVPIEVDKDEGILLAEHHSEILDKIVHMDFKNVSVEEEAVAFRSGIEEIFGHETEEIEFKEAGKDDEKVALSQDVQIQKITTPLGEGVQIEVTTIVCPKEMVEEVLEKQEIKFEDVLSSAPQLGEDKNTENMSGGKNHYFGDDMLHLTPPRNITPHDNQEEETEQNTDHKEPPSSPVTPGWHLAEEFGNKKPVVEGLAKAIAEESLEKAVEEAINPKNKKAHRSESEKEIKELINGEENQDEEKEHEISSEDRKEANHADESNKEAKWTKMPTPSIEINGPEDFDDETQPAIGKDEAVGKKAEDQEKAEITVTNEDAKEIESIGKEEAKSGQEEIIVDEKVNKMEITVEEEKEKVVLRSDEESQAKDEIGLAIAEARKSAVDIEEIPSSPDSILNLTERLRNHLPFVKTSINVSLSKDESNEFVNAEVVEISEVKTAEKKIIKLNPERIEDMSVEDLLRRHSTELTEKKPPEFAQIWSKGKPKEEADDKSLGSPLSKSSLHDFSKSEENQRNIFAKPKKVDFKDFDWSEEGTSVSTSVTSKTTYTVTHEIQDQLVQMIDVPDDDESNNGPNEVIGEEPKSGDVTTESMFDESNPMSTYDNSSPPVPAPRQVKKTVTLEVELNKVNEEYKELVNWVGEGAACIRAEGTAPPIRNNRVSDIIVSLDPVPDLEKKEMTAQAPITKKPKKGKMFCCFCFRRPSFLKK